MSTPSEDSVPRDESRRGAPVRLPRRIFLSAGIYGLAVLVPQYFLETRIGVEQPPPITHPEYFYGFVGIAVAWQVAFLCIAWNPSRYRLLMIPSVIEKLAFGAPGAALFAQGRLAGSVLGFAVIDLVLAGLFCLAYLRTPPS
jgi:hypothetical protein